MRDETVPGVLKGGVTAFVVGTITNTVVSTVGLPSWLAGGISAAVGLSAGILVVKHQLEH